METLRREVLEEMARDGRIYGKHEVKALAKEALAWRDGKNPLEYDGVVVEVPRALLEGGYYNSVKIREMKVGDTKLIRFEPTLMHYVYSVVHIMPEPKK